MSEHFSVLLVVLPLVVAPLIVVINNRNLAWFASLVTCAVCLYMAVVIAFDVNTGAVIHYELGGWKPPWGIEYKIDALNALVAVIVCMIAVVTLIYARKSVEAEIEKHVSSMFYASFLLCFLGLLGIALTGDIFNLFVFLEISSLSSYALIALGKSRKALTASFHYLVLGTLGATFFLIGVGFAYAATGTLNMDDLSVKLEQLTSYQLLHTAYAFIIVGVALKAAIYPLHLWLPSAYTYAPSVISVFLSATATKVAIYVLIRCLYDVFSVSYFVSTGMPILLTIFGGVGILYGAIRAIQARGMKKMLAYSSVSQVGYMVLGLGFVSKAGVMAALLHLFNHALMKGVLFMAAGIFVYRANSALLHNLKGFARLMPFTFVAMVIGGLSLIGVPGTVGFISKWQLLLAAMEQSSWGLVALILVGSLLAIVYMWKLIEILYFQPPDKPRMQHIKPGVDTVQGTPFSMSLGLWLCAIGCIVFGINTEFTLTLASTAADVLLGTMEAAND